MAHAQHEVELAQATDQPAQKKGFGMKKLLLIVPIVLILIGASVGATLYLTGAFTEKPVPVTAEGTQAPPVSTSSEPPIYITFDPPFTVTFNDPKKARFLQIKLDVATRDPKVEEAIKTHMSALRNGLVMLFSSQKPEDLLDRDGKEDLRQHALEEIQKTLRELTGNPGVDKVFFTSFVMQ